MTERQWEKQASGKTSKEGQCHQDPSVLLCPLILLPLSCFTFQWQCSNGSKMVAATPDITFL